MVGPSPSFLPVSIASASRVDVPRPARGVQVRAHRVSDDRVVLSIPLSPWSVVRHGLALLVLLAVAGFSWLLLLVLVVLGPGGSGSLPSFLLGVVGILVATVAMVQGLRRLGTLLRHGRSVTLELGPLEVALAGAVPDQRLNNHAVISRRGAVLLHDERPRRGRVDVTVALPSGTRFKLGAWREADLRYVEDALAAYSLLR